MNYDPGFSGARCARCGAVLESTQAFCPGCGMPNPNRRLVCSGCGTMVDATHDFCPECGQKVGMTADAGVSAAISAFNASVTGKKKKRPKIIAIILAAVLLVGGIGAAVTGRVIAGQKKKQAIETYLSTASDFYRDCLEVGGYLEEIGNEIHSAWYKYVSSSYPYYNGKRLYDPDDAIEAAHNAQKTTVAAVKLLSNSIQSKFNELLQVPDEKNQALLSVRDAVKQTYRTYLELFETVISPSGNYSSWKSDFQNSDSRMASALEQLSNLL